MKKICSVLLSLIMIMTLLCGTALAEEIAGKWFLETVSMQGLTLPASDVGMVMDFTLNADGTGSVFASMGGEDQTQPVEWKQEGNIVTLTVDGDPMDFTLTEEGKMEADVEGVTMTLAKEGAVAATEGGEVVTAPLTGDITLESFNGNWECTEAIYNGQTIPMATMGGMSMKFVLENGEGTMELVQEDGEINTSEVMGVLEEIEQEDGTTVTALALTAADSAMTSSTMYLVLNAEGQLEFCETSTGIIFVLENMAQ